MSWTLRGYCISSIITVLLNRLIHSLIKCVFCDDFLIDIECGWPARIPSGSYDLVNGTRDYLSAVSYSCADGFQLIGRADLICDVDGRWNGPPPRCERECTNSLIAVQLTISDWIEWVFKSMIRWSWSKRSVIVGAGNYFFTWNTQTFWTIHPEL